MPMDRRRLVQAIRELDYERVAYFRLQQGPRHLPSEAETSNGPSRCEFPVELAGLELYGNLPPARRCLDLHLSYLLP